MFCTKPGTKTQLVYITSPCMKQQISTHTPPKRNSVGRHIRRCAGPAYSLPVAPALRHETLSAFHPTQHVHTEAFFSWPGILTPCTAFTHALPPQPPWRVALRLEGRDRAAGLPMEHELSCNSRRQKGESCGLHPSIHTAQLRTWIKQHTLLQVHPYCPLFFTKREVLGDRLGTW